MQISAKWYRLVLCLFPPVLQATKRRNIFDLNAKINHSNCCGDPMPNVHILLVQIEPGKSGEHAKQLRILPIIKAKT